MCSLVVLTFVVVVPKLSTKFLLLPDRILVVSTLVFAIDALYANVSFVLHSPFSSLPLLHDLLFAGFLFSFAYVAARKVFANERRLLEIDSELETARRIQLSLIPTRVPELQKLLIAARYQPMTAVAGDFYEFISMDQHRLGVLVADVSGHGVPAALIASMIKVAVQSVVGCSDKPAEVLRRLNRILSSQLRGQFVTAAYLWIDTELRKASYSAAGHPPLLCWRDGTLNRIESNGLLFGVMAESDYPVRDMPVTEGERYLLYTDGVVEPENAAGDSFGDHRLEQVVISNQFRSPDDFANEMLSEVRHWHAPSTTQQDDITLVIIDVV